ncbi:MAG: peptidylprolyl isomerase [archaeon]
MAGNDGKIKASHILVDKHSRALEIAQMIINKQKTFEQAAAEFSSCPSKKKGGDLGSFARGQMVREFDEAARKLQVGQMTTEPVKTQFGYHLIKRTG